MIEYTCKGCGEQMESPDSMTGKMEACPSCKRKNKVPSPEQLAAKAEKEAEKKRKAAEREQKKAKRAEIKARVNKPGSLREVCCSVVGVCEGNRQKLIRLSRKQLDRQGERVEPLFLVRERDNPHDKNAVQVQYLYAAKNRYHFVGYLQRDAAREVAKLLDRGWVVDVKGYPHTFAAKDDGRTLWGMKVEGYLISPERAEAENEYSQQ